MDTDWKRKLTSRKFWALLAALAVSIMLIFSADAGTTEKTSGAILALGGVVTYILGESKIDAAGIKKESDNT